jgi:Endonuclease/Exonuclease/phosphatase family
MRRFGRRRHGSRAGSRRHFLLHAPAAASERVKKRWSRTRSARAALVRDTVDDPIARDFDFTPSEGWTATTYKAKKQNLAAALNELHGGLGPELLGVAEVEGDQVFEELIAETGNTHLKVVKDPAGTSDLRGIDVSLAYDDCKLSVVDKHSHVVHLRYQTRDIFEVIFKVKDTNEALVVIASHWPSRRHGRLESEPLRIAVAENIAFLVRDHVRVDSVTYEQLRAQNNLGPVQLKWETPVLLFGDFNDEPFDTASSTTSRPRASLTA